MLCTPLEQFQIISLFSIKLFCFDLSITNLVLVNLLVLMFFSSIVFFFSSNTNYLAEMKGKYFSPSILILSNSNCEEVSYKASTNTCHVLGMKKKLLSAK